MERLELALAAFDLALVAYAGARMYPLLHELAAPARWWHNLHRTLLLFGGATLAELVVACVVFERGGSVAAFALLMACASLTLGVVMPLHWRLSCADPRERACLGPNDAYALLAAANGARTALWLARVCVLLATPG